MKKLQRKVTIDNKVVEFVNAFCGIEVYQCMQGDNSYLTTYYVKDDAVVAEHFLSAEMGQGFGFIDDNNWKKMEG